MPATVISPEQFEAFALLSRVRDYLASQRGTGNCAQAVARNSAIRIVNDARFAVMGRTPSIQTLAREDAR